MNLIETYALQCGAKISDIDINEKFFPLPFEKYITFQPFSKDAKNYDYWDSVLELIVPPLQSAGIQIVQIGGSGERPLPGCFPTQGRTNIAQMAYLVKNAILHLSTDSCSAHLAGGYNIPLVAIYSTNYAHNVEPFFGDKNRRIILEPDHSETKPCFNEREYPKQINKIKPEEIAAAVLKLLNIPFNYPYKTLFLGNFFPNKSLEVIPNQVLQINPIPPEGLTIRMDLEFNENILAEHLKRYKCLILTNRTINSQILATFKQNIAEVVYIIDENHSPSFPVILRKLGINCRLISQLPVEKVNQFKLEYFDKGIIWQINSDEPDFLKENRQYFYKTSKFIFSNQKLYPSLWAYRNNRPAQSLTDITHEFDKNLIPEEFYKEYQSFQILVAKE